MKPKDKWHKEVTNFLVGTVLGFGIIWLSELLGIFEILARCILGFVVFAIVVDLIILFVFLYINWRKSLADCWDKFSE